ncbi:MAG: DASS family sodium-coupled anion symporter [Candidatus Marinimicrobia bacterium]|nr:DASS family sodium-coupled anion symporter [Candidatus Neomarinimicrobiota bacterium]
MEVRNQLSSNLIYWVSRNIWLIIASIFGILFYFIPAPAGLSIEGWRTIIIAVIALILIVTEPIPLPGIAFIIIILQVYFGVADANSVSKAFMNDAVFFIMGSLMLAVAIIQQGWDARIALGIIRLTGSSTTRIAFGFSTIAAILSSFIGEHTVAAIMLPIGLTLIRFTSEDKEQTTQLSALILFSIAYGCLIGSIGTPSGGGRNVIMMIYWKEYGVEPLSYWRWMVYVYPLVLLQLPLLAWVLRSTFKPEFSRLDSGVRRLKVQVARSGKITDQQKLAAFLFLVVFIGWVFLSETFGLGIIAITGVVLYIVTDLVKWEDINKHVNWGVIILFGAAISLGVQIKNSGAAHWLANIVLNSMGDEWLNIPIVTDSIIILLTTTMANLLSSSATVAVLGPVILNLPGDAIHTGLVATIVSAFGYFTAVAAPACTIVYSCGLLRSKDFLRAGWKMGTISIGLILVYANVYWRFLQ